MPGGFRQSAVRAGADTADRSGPAVDSGRGRPGGTPPWRRKRRSTAGEWRIVPRAIGLALSGTETALQGCMSRLSLAASRTLESCQSGSAV